MAWSLFQTTFLCEEGVLFVFFYQRQHFPDRMGDLKALITAFF